MRLMPEISYPHGIPNSSEGSRFGSKFYKEVGARNFLFKSNVANRNVRREQNFKIKTLQIFFIHSKNFFFFLSLRGMFTVSRSVAHFMKLFVLLCLSS